jgi:hypothetical protein
VQPELLQLRRLVGQLKARYGVSNTSIAALIGGAV